MANKGGEIRKKNICLRKSKDLFEITEIKVVQSKGVNWYFKIYHNKTAQLSNLMP